MESKELYTYMSESIAGIMTKAYKSMLFNPREALFAHKMRVLFKKSEKKRERYS